MGPHLCTNVNTDSRGFRYAVLVLICLFAFGSYYSYDMPSAVQGSLVGQTEGGEVVEDPGIYNLTSNEYSLLYSIYTICNFVSVCFGGFFVDKFGFNVCAIVFSLALCTGQAVFAAGVTANEYWVMVFGRAIFGLGGGNIGTCQNCACTQYFKGKELSAAFSTSLAVSRLGSVLNFFTTPLLVDTSKPNHNLPTIFWMGFGLCVGSLSFIIGFFIMDQIKLRSDQAKMIAEDKAAEEEDLDDIETGRDIEDGVEENLDKPQPEQIPKNATRSVSRKRAINIRDVKEFGVLYWLLDVLCGTFYSCIFVFISICTDFIAVKYPGQYSRWERSVITGIIYDVSLVVSPWFGIVVDKVGNRLWFQLGALLFLFPGYCLLAFTSITPIVSMLLFGISYSVMAAVLWSAVPLIVPIHTVGSAMSFMTAVQMVTNTIIQSITGALAPEPGNTDPTAYNNVVYLFLGIAGLSILIEGAIMFMDKHGGGWLNKRDTTGKYRDDVLLKKKEEAESDVTTQGESRSVEIDNEIA